MSFLDRLKGLLGPPEPERQDPYQEISRVLRDLKQRLAEGRARVATAIRDEKRMEREVLRTSAEVQRALAEAKVYLARGDEVAARRALARKVEAQNLLDELGRELSRQREAIGILKEGLAQLADRLRKISARRATLRARQRRAIALEHRKDSLEDDDLAAAEALLEDASLRLDAEEELLSAGGAGDALERRILELEHSGEFQTKALEDLRKKLDEGESS